MRLLHFQSSQNGLFGHYLGNGKRYDPKNMLCPHECGDSASIKMVWGSISFRYQNAQIESGGQPKWYFWPISWQRKEIALKYYSSLNVAILHLKVVIGLCFSPGSRDIPILKWAQKGSSHKRGFTKKNFGGLFLGAFMTNELQKNVPRRFTQFSP